MLRVDHCDVQTYGSLFVDVGRAGDQGGPDVWGEHHAQWDPDAWDQRTGRSLFLELGYAVRP